MSFFGTRAGTPSGMSSAQRSARRRTPMQRCSRSCDRKQTGKGLLAPGEKGTTPKRTDWPLRATLQR